MRLSYIKPESVLEYFDAVDVIATSTGGSDLPSGKDDFETDEIPLPFNEQ